MCGRFRQRLARDEGFTLIELLVVIVIVGVLVAIAVPSYLSFKDNANNKSAQASLRMIVPAVENYYTDNGTYVGMTPVNLKSTYDQSIDIAKYTIPAADLAATSYCVQSTSGGLTWRKNGPAAALENSACP